MKQSKMNRRSLLKAAGLAAVGATIAPSCAARVVRNPTLPSLKRLAKPNVSWDRLVRTVVGLRPARRGGLRLEAERIDAKTVIHNYGHSSLGVTLSWGTAHLAAEEAMKTGQLRCAVIGSGSVGLATARLLQRRGYDVTIYAKNLPPDTTSNVAYALWGPVYDPVPFAQEFRQKYACAARFAHRYFQDLVGDYYGVRWREYYSDGDAARIARLKDDPFRDLYVDLQELGPKDHPFPVPSTSVVLRWMGLQIDTPIYLNALVRDFQLAGGRIAVRDFPDVQSLLALPEPVVMNCTGLGARALFNDQRVIPHKGQVIVFPPQPEVDYMFDISHDMASRQDGLVLSGGRGKDWTQNGSGPNDWTLEPDEKAVRESVAQAVAFFSAMR